MQVISCSVIQYMPFVNVGLLCTYLAAGCGRKETQGAFRALQRGYAHWVPGRLDRLEVNYCHYNIDTIHEDGPLSSVFVAR